MTVNCRVADIAANMPSHRAIDHVIAAARWYLETHEPITPEWRAHLETLEAAIGVCMQVIDENGRERVNAAKEPETPRDEAIQRWYRDASVLRIAPTVAIDIAEVRERFDPDDCTDEAFLGDGKPTDDEIWQAMGVVCEDYDWSDETSLFKDYVEMWIKHNRARR